MSVIQILKCLTAIAILVTCTYGQSKVDYSQYVDPFHGTTNGGNMFPGVVAAPYAIVKLGPDVKSGTTDAYSGYLPSGRITGFSMTHMSGTGGAPKYGVVSQMPVAGAVTNLTVDLSVERSGPDIAQVGYYKSSLSNGITVELAATEHAGMYKYTFPSNQLSIVVDVSHVLPSFRGLGWSQGYTGGYFRVFPDGHYEGSGTYNNGWNLAPDWNIYFCGRFSAKPLTSQTFIGSQLTTQASVSGTEPLGGVFTFSGTVIKSRVGISFISSAKACNYITQEIPAGAALKTLVSRAKSKWNTRVFSKLTTTDTSTDNLKQLYTSLYGMMLAPSNKTGENPGWTSTEPYYDDIMTYWDLFRCWTPLTHILQPQAYEEQIRSLIDIWRNTGWMPDARTSNFNGRTQGGSNADNVLADAYVKGVRGAVSWADGYSAMLADAENIPPNNDDPIAPDSADNQGRGALSDWIQRGYITPKYTRAVSRAVEYSANDFALYQVAKGLGRIADATKYLNRSRNWRNHWNPAAASLGFSGFVVPRDADGSFASQDPLSCGGCYWGDAYYQGTPWEYSVNAHHDINAIIQRSGGSMRFADRLNKMFEGDTFSGNAQFNHTIINPGNEPSFATPYLYNFVGRPDLSAAASRHIAKSYFSSGTGGIPGNSDGGAMQSWLLWNMIGLYPVTGQTTFLIHTPWFSNLKIDLGGGKSLTITSTGGNSDTAFYVQSLKVNGEPWKQSWVTWNDVFASGGTMEFVLGTTPRQWATGPLPPSPAS